LDSSFEFTRETISVLKVIPDGAPANEVGKQSIGYRLY